VDEHTPSVFLMSSGGFFDKVMSNSKRSRPRRPVIAIAGEGDRRDRQQVAERATT